MHPTGDSDSQAHSEERRTILKILAAAGGALGAASLLPGRWLKPVVKIGVLPVHAQASPTPEPSPSPEPTAIPGSQTFVYTGTPQNWTVPAGVTSITVDAYGAQGGNSVLGGVGGQGGHVIATLTVSPGDPLSITVGGRGHHGSGITDGAGGYGGGGDGSAGFICGGGGGGASWLRRSDNVLIAAGGGGGGAYNYRGGNGGGATGGTGEGGAWGGSGGGAGPANGGAGGLGAANGADGSDEMGGSGAEYCGGGGGGYSGGGGGASGGYDDGAGAGGGGASYYDPGATNITNLQGGHDGDGEVTISWG